MIRRTKSTENGRYGYSGRQSRVTIEQGVLHKNTWSGLRLHNDAHANVYDSEVNENVSNGMFIDQQSTIEIDQKTKILDNDRSGIVAYDRSEVTLKKVTIEDNTNYGVSLRQSKLTAEEVSVSNNGRDGIRARDASSIVLNKGFVNENSRNGISASETTVKLKDVELNENLWAGMYAKERSTIEVTKTDVIDNLGRGIDLEDNTKGTIKEDVVVAYNLDSGIAVNKSPGNILIEDIGVYKNFSPDMGGGFVIWDDSNPQILDNKIFSNTAFSSGGGISVTDSQATIGSIAKPNTIEKNRSMQGAGGGF